MRSRRMYANSSIGRDRTQQAFLNTIMTQFLNNRSSINVVDMANIFIGNVDTNIQLNHLVWFGREFMKLDADSINFHMMPGNIADSVGRQSYVTIYVDEWLELVNSSLNPFHDDIAPEDVSILTRGADRRLYVTDGNRRGDLTWGS